MFLQCQFHLTPCFGVMEWDEISPINTAGDPVTFRVRVINPKEFDEDAGDGSRKGVTVGVGNRVEWETVAKAGNDYCNM